MRAGFDRIACAGVSRPFPARCAGAAGEDAISADGKVGTGGDGAARTDTAVATPVCTTACSNTGPGAATNARQTSGYASAGQSGEDCAVRDAAGSARNRGFGRPATCAGSGQIGAELVIERRRFRRKGNLRRHYCRDWQPRLGAQD